MGKNTSIGGLSGDSFFETGDLLVKGKKYDTEAMKDRDASSRVYDSFSEDYPNSEWMLVEALDLADVNPRPFHQQALGGRLNDGGKLSLV